MTTDTFTTADAMATADCYYYTANRLASLCSRLTVRIEDYPVGHSGGTTAVLPLLIVWLAYRR